MVVNSSISSVRRVKESDAAPQLYDSTVSEYSVLPCGKAGMAQRIAPYPASDTTVVDKTFWRTTVALLSPSHHAPPALAVAGVTARVQSAPSPRRLWIMGLLKLVSKLSINPKLGSSFDL